MLSKPLIIGEKYAEEHSGELAVAVDVTYNRISALFYDMKTQSDYARGSVIGVKNEPNGAVAALSRFIITVMREQNVSAADVKSVAIAAGVHISRIFEEELSSADLFLQPQTEIFVLPFISAAISGRLSAAILTLPDEDCVFADFGRELNIAVKRGGEIFCAALALGGAFDGSGLESGVPPEKGAIDIVKCDGSARIYEVIGDGNGVGISPLGAVMAAGIMRDEGILDDDGIMTDRDNFYIGEDFYISQADIRVIQADKARASAALSLFSDIGRAVFSGEPFSNPEGLSEMRKIGAIPDGFGAVEACRNSVERGIVEFLVNESKREEIVQIAQNSTDITTKILPEFDRRYLESLAFK